MKKRTVIFTLLIAVCGLFAFKGLEHRVMKKRFFHSGISGTPYIVIKKSDYELSVYDDEGWYATYPAVFGSKSLDDKLVMGDRKTPEGEYKIASKRPHEKWDKMMLLNYPTQVDIDKFNERKAKGLIPKDAKLGNGIGIHGTWNRDDMAVDYYQNWTNGCVSLKREDIEELYNIIPVGTKVTIQH